VFIIYTPGNEQQSNIIQTLSKRLYRQHNNIIVTRIPAEEKISAVDNDKDLLIGIGPTGMASANRYYPKANKLYISTGPQKHDPEMRFDDRAAILYMTQPYCRQLQTIKSINNDWKIISLLNFQEQSTGIRKLRQCGKKYGLKIYSVNTASERDLSNNLKKALSHSDILLAMPDKNIYNSKTVKNILLTSYRYRKPVFAFSGSFVRAGALAAVHSSSEQIGASASSIIEQYYKNENRFIKSINYPTSFDISINKQVFNALELAIPDVKKLKRELIRTNLDNQEKTK